MGIATMPYKTAQYFKGEKKVYYFCPVDLKVSKESARNIDIFDYSEFISKNFGI